MSSSASRSSIDNQPQTRLNTSPSSLLKPTIMHSSSTCLFHVLLSLPFVHRQSTSDPSQYITILPAQTNNHAFFLHLSPPCPPQPPVRPSTINLRPVSIHHHPPCSNQQSCILPPPVSSMFSSASRSFIHHQPQTRLNTSPSSLLKPTIMHSSSTCLLHVLLNLPFILPPSTSDPSQYITILPAQSNHDAFFPHLSLPCPLQPPVHPSTINLRSVSIHHHPPCSIQP